MEPTYFFMNAVNSENAGCMRDENRVCSEAPLLWLVSNAFTTASKNATDTELSASNCTRQ